MRRNHRRRERYAPTLPTASLDFERVVNSYSISATRSRLNSVKKQNHSETSILNRSDYFHDNLETRPILQHTSPRTTHAYESFDSSTPESHDANPVLDLSSPNSNSIDYADILSSRRCILGYSGRTALRWVLTFLIGLLTGCIAVLIVKSTNFVVTYREAGLNRLEMYVTDQMRASMYHTVQDSLYNATNKTDENSAGLAPVTHAVIKWWEPNPITDVLAQRYGFKGIFLTYASFNLLLALSSSLMCLKFAPEAVGSGIPEVKAYLNGVRVKKFSNWSCFFIKIIATILSVSSGLCIGPEGPLVHLGAILGAGVTKTSQLELWVRGFRQRFPHLSNIFGCASSQEDMSDDIEQMKNNKCGVYRSSERIWRCLEKNSFFSQTVFQLSHFRNDAERRDLISIGVAAGFAAAFGAPVGGVLFSLEEASTFFANQMLWKSLFATAIATFCIAAFSGDLTQFSIISLGEVSTSNENLLHRRFKEIPLYVLMGVGGGLMGALFNTIWANVQKKRKFLYRRIANYSANFCTFYKLLEVGSVSFTTSLLTFFLPLWSWSCNEVGMHSSNGNGMRTNDFTIHLDKSIDITSSFSHQFNCGDGKSNMLASVLFGSREMAISSILTDPSTFGCECLLAVGLLFYFLMIVTYGVSLPCGIFMPTVLAGAAIGGYAGLTFRRLISYDLEPSLFALLGATALLAGTQRNTVSLCVILMEGTGQTKFLIPIIVTIVVSRYVGDLFSQGIYELGMELQEYPYLEHIDQEYFDIHDVTEIMSYPVICLRQLEDGRRIAKVLNTCTHDGFPVVDQHNHLLGLVRRDQLIALLECGIFVETVPWNKSFNEESLDLISPTSSADDSLTAIFSGSSTSNQKEEHLVEDDLRFSFYAHDDELSECVSYDELKSNVPSNPSRDNSNFNHHVRQNSTLMDMALFIRDDRYTSNDGLSPLGRDDEKFTFNAHVEYESSNDEWLKDNIKIMPDNTVILGADESLPIIKNFTKCNNTVVRYGQNGKLTISLSSADYNKRVDVQAVMNRTCHCVLENCPLSTAYKTFTILGLRHLCVLGRKGELAGIITRSNLHEEYIKRSIRKRS